MGKNQNNSYQALFDAWKKANPLKKGDELQRELNTYWKENKSNSEMIRDKIAELKKQGSKSSTLDKWVIPSQSPKPIASVFSAREATTSSSSKRATAIINETEEYKAPMIKRSRVAPKQEELSSIIGGVNEKIVRLKVLKNNRVDSTEDSINLSKLLKEKRKLETELRRKKTLAVNSQRQRDKKRRNYENFKKNHPDLVADLENAMPSTNSAGRPRMQNEDLLLKTIVDIVAPESSADIGRRTELLRACTTLNDLKAEVEKRIEGIKLSRSALYIRLQPRNSATLEGNRHIKTVPVKLIRAQNSKRKDHEDNHFAAALHRHLKDLAELMGNEVSNVISQDDKARIHMGLPAASKESPILMHMRYRVTLPDHDYVVASRHKLIPSIYGCVTFNKRKLSYSGPTYIAVRSGKHNKSSAVTHSRDVQRFLSDAKFENYFKTKSGEVKPLLFLFTDGAPDENPRFQQVVEESAVTFRALNLDAMYVSCHAPGQSAYNPVERRMAPLSRDLSGVILPHDTYGSHLDSNRQTIDRELEIKNFAKAGETLAEIWNETVIDNQPVTAEYIAPVVVTGEEENRSWLSDEWKSTHIRHGQYCLQIIKCQDSECCRPYRSNSRNVLRDGFLPSPVKYEASDAGPIPCKSAKQRGYFGSLFSRMALSKLDPEWKFGDTIRPIPFDFYCPSVETKLQERLCRACNGYFVTKGGLAAHIKKMHVSSVESIMETIEEVVRKYAVEDEDELQNIGIIPDLQAWLQSDFVDVDE